MGVEQTETQQTEKLIKKVKLFEAIVNKTQDGIIVFNHQLEVMFANHAAGVILGDTPTNLRGKPLSQFIPQDVRSKHEKLVSMFSASEQTRQELFDWRDIQCRRCDGSLFPAQITIEKFTMSGALVYIVSLLDKTEIRGIETEKSETELSHLKTVLQKDYFVNTLQMNFEQSITKIAKSAQTIKDNFDTKAIQDAMNGIMNNAFAALTLCQKAQFISETTKDVQKFNLVDQSLYGSFDRIRSSFDAVMQKKHFKIIWDIPQTARKTKLEKCLIFEQILYCITEDTICNAIGGEVIIQLASLQENEDKTASIELLFRNSKFGVPQQVINTVLEASSSSDIPEGTNLHNKGMRLRLAKQLINQCDGTMSIHSHPIEGTEIVVNLCMDLQGAAKQRKVAKQAARDEGNSFKEMSQIDENPQDSDQATDEELEKISTINQDDENEAKIAV